MSRTVPAALLTAVQQTPYRLSRLVRITRQDEVVIRLTDSVYSIVIGSETFRSDVGFTISSLMVGLNLGQVSGLTMQAAMVDGGFTRSDIRERRFYGATIQVYECDWTDPENTMLLQFRGVCGRASYTETGLAVIEVQPLTNDVNIADEVYSQTCRASLGDGRCTFPLEDYRVNFTVTEVVGSNVFKVDTFGPTAAGTPSSDYFGQGQLKWLTGDNELWETDILTSDFAASEITLFFPMPSDILVGDTGKMYPGCDRQYSTCIDKFANWLNFRGEPFAPQGSIL